MRRVPTGLLFVIAGCVTVLLSAAIDIVTGRKPGIGQIQVAGMVVGIFVVLIGLVERGRLRPHVWFPGLALLYASGVLVIGLWPVRRRTAPDPSFLVAPELSVVDMLLNTLGFVPLGYLLAAAAAETNLLPARWKRSLVVPLLAALSLSALIELAQGTVVPGRYPALADWLLNGAGALAGIGLAKTLRRNPSG